MRIGKHSHFEIQEGSPEDWVRIVDTELPSPDDFSECGVQLSESTYQVAARSIVVLIRSIKRPDASATR